MRASACATFVTSRRCCARHVRSTSSFILRLPDICYLCERSPLEAVHTNILGVQNVIQCAVDNEVSRLVFTSSDKAVNPTNVMGTSKLIGRASRYGSSNGLASAGCNISLDSLRQRPRIEPFCHTDLSGADPARWPGDVVRSEHDALCDDTRPSRMAGHRVNSARQSRRCPYHENARNTHQRPCRDHHSRAGTAIRP